MKSKGYQNLTNIWAFLRPKSPNIHQINLFILLLYGIHNLLRPLKFEKTWSGWHLIWFSIPQTVWAENKINEDEEEEAIFFPDFVPPIFSLLNLWKCESVCPSVCVCIINIITRNTHASCRQRGRNNSSSSSFLRETRSLYKLKMLQWNRKRLLEFIQLGTKVGLKNPNVSTVYLKWLLLIPQGKSVKAEIYLVYKWMFLKILQWVNAPEKLAFKPRKSRSQSEI